MVKYCENKSDCRRKIQLQYFGEVFDPRLCKNSDTVCDNCSSGALIKLDITAMSKNIIAGVTRLSQRSRITQKNFTILHLVDILRGMKNKKVIESEWNSDPLYNSAGRFNATDCGRILKKLVIEGFLWEDMVVSKDGMAMAYVKLGPRANLISNGGQKIELDVPAPKTLQMDRQETEEEDDQLKKLEEDCFDSLKDAISRTFPDLKSCFAALPAECFQEIAKKLPSSEGEMMDIDQMTEIRFRKYGETLLAVCDQFLEKRMVYLQDKQMAEMLNKEEAGQFSDGAALSGMSSGGGYGSGRSR